MLKVRLNDSNPLFGNIEAPITRPTNGVITAVDTIAGSASKAEPANAKLPNPGGMAVAPIF